MRQHRIEERTDGGRCARAIACSCETHLSGQPISVGLDVIRVAEITAALDRFGERYVWRVFTPHEAAYCHAGRAAVGARRFAARFAAKEATVKALAPTARWTDWRTIEVRRLPSGACALALYGEAAALAAERGIRHLALSMSHDGGMAVACVVALGAPTAPPPHALEPRHV